MAATLAQQFYEVVVTIKRQHLQRRGEAHLEGKAERLLWLHFCRAGFEVGISHHRRSAAECSLSSRAKKTTPPPYDAAGKMIPPGCIVDDAKIFQFSRYDSSNDTSENFKSIAENAVVKM